MLMEVLGFIGLLTLVILSTFDKMIYNGENHFAAFMRINGLNNFLYLSSILFVSGIILHIIIIIKSE